MTRLLFEGYRPDPPASRNPPIAAPGKVSVTKDTPRPLRAALVAFGASLAVTLALACFVTLSLAPLCSPLPPAILLRAFCVCLSVLVASLTFDACNARGRK